MWRGGARRRRARGLARRRARPAGLRRLAARRPGRGRGHLGGARRGARALPRGPRPRARSSSASHDWGGLIGLRWACDAPERVRGLVVSARGFFPDGKWHGLAQVMRTPGEGEELAGEHDARGARAMLGSVSRMDEAAIDACWKAYATEERRAAQLALYRSGDFEKLAPYAGRLAGARRAGAAALGRRRRVRAARRRARGCATSSPARGSSSSRARATSSSTTPRADGRASSRASSTRSPVRRRLGRPGRRG